MSIIKNIKNIIIFIVVLFFIFFILSRGHVYRNEDIEYGITFSKKQIENLGLDWKKAYLDIFEELNIKKIRIPAYWNEIESSENSFYWDDLDWLVSEASKQDAEIILAVGGRLPRWPECHFPGWVEEKEEDFREEKILNYIEKIIKRYQENNSIIAWQVENEPFLSHFGKCPELNKKFLDKEIELAKKIDSRPIVVTDSGELSIWIPAARRGDIFGTTMYRDTYSEYLKRYIHYPISPGFFRFKKNIAKMFTNPKKWIIIELQAEPWGRISYQNLSKEEKDLTMNPDKFKEILEFSRMSGFKEIYLWGVEWWYWEKEVNKNNEMWEMAKKIFKNN